MTAYNLPHDTVHTKNLSEDHESFTHASIISGLETDFIGRSLHFFDILESTNLRASELGDEGAPEGTAVVADAQHSGRGRRGRSWFSPEGKNIYTSVVLRPCIPLPKASQLTLTAAVALAETISVYLKNFTDVGTNIKWPNDILVGGRKCAGILTEMKSSDKKIDYVVVGIGINVNILRHELPGELTDTATSMYAEKGEKTTRSDLIQTLYLSLEKWYKNYLEEGFAHVRPVWNSLSAINGKNVRAAASGAGMTHKHGDEGYEEGVALRVNENGALLLRKADGRIVEVVAGEVISI